MIQLEFQPVEVNLNDPDNQYPVPTVRADGDSVYLVLATCWVLFVITVYLCTTKRITDFCNGIAAKFRRTQDD